MPKRTSGFKPTLTYAEHKSLAKLLNDAEGSLEAIEVMLSNRFSESSKLFQTAQSAQYQLRRVRFLLKKRCFDDCPGITKEEVSEAYAQQ